MIYNFLVKLCKCGKLDQAEFMKYCQTSDMKGLEMLFKNYEVEEEVINNGMLLACQYGNDSVVKLMIEKGATRLNEGLEIACKNNRYSTSELLVQKGAEIVVGLRTAKSMNILRMLYRYEQKSEIIK